MAMVTDGTIAAASAAIWAKAISSRSEIAAVEELGAAAVEVAAVVVAAKDVAAPIGGGVLRGSSSAGVGELGAPEAMELRRTRKGVRSRGGERDRA